MAARYMILVELIEYDNNDEVGTTQEVVEANVVREGKDLNQMLSLLHSIIKVVSHE